MAHNPQSGYVTISQDHFDTLVRRANSIPESGYLAVHNREYEQLIRTAHSHANLKRNLMDGGVPEDSIDCLCQTTAPQSEGPPNYDRNDLPDGPNHHAVIPGSGPSLSSAPSRNNGHGPSGLPRHGPQLQPCSKGPESGIGMTQSWANEPQKQQNPLASPQTQNKSWADTPPKFAKICARTVQLTGLATDITYADVTAAVCGGMLLEIIVRALEGTANVSFLREEAATAFYSHVSKNDIYIKQKKVGVRWADRQFQLPDTVARQIERGSTRNLILRRVSTIHTEASIRCDLEHIHQLVVIRVMFNGSSCYISTNSVHNAGFARTCMMSRAAYKGSKIDWDADECDKPVLAVGKVLIQPTQPMPPQKQAIEVRNRFATLRFDDEDDSLSADCDSTTDAFSIGDTSE